MKKRNIVHSALLPVADCALCLSILPAAEHRRRRTFCRFAARCPVRCGTALSAEQASRGWARCRLNPWQEENPCDGQERGNIHHDG